MKKISVLASLAVISASVFGMEAPLGKGAYGKSYILSLQQIQKRFEEVKNYCRNNEQGQKINKEFLYMFGIDLPKAYENSAFNVDGMVIKGKSVMGVAYEKGSTDLVSYLISLGADTNRKNQYEQTPFHIAWVNDNYEVAKLLFNPEANYLDDLLSLSANFRGKGRVGLIGYILSNTRNTDDWINKKVYGIKTLVEIQAKGGHWGFVQFLIELGANASDEVKSLAEIKGKDTDTYKQLKSIVEKKRAAEVAKKAAEKESQETEKERTPQIAQKEANALLSAICRGKVAIVRFLIKRGVAVTEDMLIDAIFGGNFDILKCCVEQGGGARWITEDVLEIAKDAECSKEMIDYLKQKMARK